jgi:hypothetical protein
LYCGAVAGSGKSTKIVDEVKLRFDNHTSSIISVPTQLMIEQYKRNFDTNEIEYVEVTHNNRSTDESIQQRLSLLFTGISAQPKVILCTHQGLILTIENMNDDVVEAALFVDEELSVIEYGHDLSVETPGLPAKMAASLKFPGTFNGNTLDSHIITTGGIYRKLKAKMDSPVYYLARHDVGETKLTWLFVLDMRAIVRKFRQVVFISALHEYSIQSFLIRSQGITLYDIGWDLANVHSTNRELEITGILKLCEWRTSIVGAQSDSLSRSQVLAFANDMLPFGECLLVSGDTNTNNYFNNRNIKAISHGLNEYRDVNYSVDLRCSMPCSIEANFLKEELGMSNSDIRIGRYYLQVYQRMMRTSIRCNDTDELLKQKVSWVVGDMKLANWLKDQFRGSPNVTVLESSLNLDIDVIKSSKVRKTRADKRFSIINDNERKWCQRKLKSCKEHLSNVTEQIIVKVMNYCLEQRRSNNIKITETMFLELLTK